MMVMKFKYKYEGTHVYIKVFVSKVINQTFAKSGDIVLNIEEFQELMHNKMDYLFIEENK
jgi:hypothetical protein